VIQFFRRMLLLGFLKTYLSERLLIKKDLFSTGNGCQILQLLINKKMKVLLESLIEKQLLGGILLGTQTKDLNNPDIGHRVFGVLKRFEHFHDERPNRKQFFL
jgi:hypothetical protein